MKTKSRSIHILIAAILFGVMFAVLNGCADMGITTAGASTLSLFIATIYLWITYGSGWTSMLSIGLLAFTGIMPAADVMAKSFGNSTTVICIGTLVLCVALEETGVTARIANWFITRKIVSKRPYMFLFMFLLASMVVTYFMEATATMILFLALASSILKDLGYTENDAFSKCMYLGILWTSSSGQAGTPIGHPVPLLMLSNLEKQTGQAVSWLKYMEIGIPFSLASLLVMMLIIRYFIRPDCSRYDTYDIEEQRRKVQPLNKKGVISLIVYLCLIVVWILPDLAGSVLPGVAAVLKKAGTALPSLIAVAVVCAIRVDGEPVLKYETAVKKIHWSTVIFIACIFVYASTFTMESGGINVFLKNLVMPLTTSLSAGMLAAVFLLFVIVVTNFASNGVTGTIGITVCAPVLLAATNDVSYVMAYGTLVAMTCVYGIGTPGGSGFVALAQKDGVITGGETFKYSMTLIAALYVLIMLVFWPMARMVF